MQRLLRQDVRNACSCSPQAISIAIAKEVPARWNPDSSLISLSRSIARKALTRRFAAGWEEEIERNRDGKNTYL